MRGYGIGTYGERVAAVYDEWYESELDTAGAVSFLRSLARGGSILELGVGTGRVALALAAAGSDVDGIDASPEMLARLAAKPGADTVTAIEGDIAAFSLPRTYSLVFAAFNTFLQLGSQERQLGCLRSAAAHLAEGGAVVLECELPHAETWMSGQRTKVWKVDADTVIVEASIHRPSEQVVESQYLIGRNREPLLLSPERLRYVPPGELRLMAEREGLSAREWWGDWRGAPFGAASKWYVAVLEAAR